MTRLGVFATDEEIQSIKITASLPVIRIGGSFPETALEHAHRCALSHGLPEITGYYGIDLRNGEFIKV